MNFRLVAMALALLGAAVLHAEESDLLIADFEGPDYGAWTVEGEAFGPGPARGTLARQMKVTGFKGEGLVNTFFKGDGTTGALTSPPLAIERKFINFLVGGGGYPGKTCVNLLLDGKAVRTATGPNTRPGGSERLHWHTWDVADLQGKQAVIQIVDRRTGGWGHINVDHIVQSNRTMAVPPEELVRSITLEKRYVNLPIENGAPKRRMQILVGGKPLREFDIELAPGKPDWWASIDLSAFRGREALLKVDSMEPGDGGLKLVDQSDEIKDAESLYNEPLRPQFHFSQRRGWNNDPNGMVYYDGEYHLFFQHNPYGIRWGNMHWGHAVSHDLVHWKELSIALYPWTQAVAHCFSGSAVVDEHDTAGFQTGDEKVIVAAFTDTGCGECIAYSNDRGRTFTYYAGNPVVEHDGRDPKLIWYAPGEHWVMAVYDQQNGSRCVAFYTSPDLKQWQFQSRLEGYYECPELFDLPVDANPDRSRWVVYAADAKYAIGRFDGKRFAPDHDGKHQVHWGAYYASQTFANPPDDRRIQMGWGRIAMEGMPFNQMMTFPCRLTLRTTDKGIRLFARPVQEIALLHRRKHTAGPTLLETDAPVVVATEGPLLDIRAEFAPGQAKSFGLLIGDTEIVYDVAKAQLTNMPLSPVDGKIRVQILVDRPSLEICGNDGRVYRTQAFRAPEDGLAVRAFANGGRATLRSLEVYELKSVWPNAGR